MLGRAAMTHNHTALYTNTLLELSNSTGTWLEPTILLAPPAERTVKSFPPSFASGLEALCQ